VLSHLRGVPRRTILLHGMGLAATLVPLNALAQGGTVSTDGFTLLEAGKARRQIRTPPRPETEVWAYNGQVPGPVLRVKRGQPVKIRLRNSLAQPTSLHWQGLRAPVSMDGAAPLTQAPILPGASFDYSFTARDAGTFLYRSQMAGHAAEQLDRGLSGLLIVDEEQPPAVDHDIALLIDDWRLDDASMVLDDFTDSVTRSGPGRMGNVLSINGLGKTHELEMRPGARCRIRLVSAMNARIITLRFDPGTKIVAVDSQPSANAFEPKGNTVLMPPGGRFEVMADLPRSAGQAYAITALIGPQATPVPLLSIKALGEPMPEKPPIAPLPGNDVPERLDLARAQRFEVKITPLTKPDAKGACWSLNGIAGTGGDDQPPLARLKRGHTVVMSLNNLSDQVMPMHWHGHAARQLFTYDDGWDPFWSDTALIQPRQFARIAFVADNPGRWLLAGAIAEHRDSGLMGWFEVA
jgi:FtsP/CotA-like multicopper oxidase with cupredoxin domain